jgi:hypothetical protein
VSLQIQHQMYIQLHAITTTLVFSPLVGIVTDQILVVMPAIIIMDVVKVIKQQLAIHMFILQHNRFSSQQEFWIFV